MEPDRTEYTSPCKAILDSRYSDGTRQDRQKKSSKNSTCSVNLDEKADPDEGHEGIGKCPKSSGKGVDPEF